MKYIREQFDDFRSSTPKHIQWLLLGVAFLIVIILLTLLLGGKTKDKSIVKNSEPQVRIDVTPNHIEFYDIKVGESSRKTVKFSANMPVYIESADISTTTAGLSVSDDCPFDSTDNCNINITYKPVKPQGVTQTELTITWYLEDQEDMMKTETIPVVFSAQKEPEPVVKPAPVPEPEPEFNDEDEESDDWDWEEEPESDPVQEMKEIIVPNPLRQEPAPVQPVQPPKQCSEFAIPGYDTSGNQIGWIKPEHGANYFYPLSDKTCSDPTGRYDMATGVITSLKDGSKIGTDSDHLGYRNVRDRNLKIPKLSAPTMSRNDKSEKPVWRADINSGNTGFAHNESRAFNRENKKAPEKATLMGSAALGNEPGEFVTSSQRFDRTFILRQFKPIPATIVSEVRADPSVYGCSLKSSSSKECDPNKNYSVPVRATVDRNVYSDDGRTIILPTGTLLMGYLSGELPGPYQAFGRMNIKWYQFIRPDGIEFNFKESQDPYSADAQGRMGVPGHGSTDYIEQMVMPLLTSLVPAAVNMIAPIADTVINQIDLDNNTVVQSGTIRSSEMAKQEVINTWNKIAQKLLVDAIDNTVPPFSIAAGTRINVFSPVDLIVSCEDTTGKKCSVIDYGKNPRRKWSDLKQEVKIDPQDSSWRGQVRSFDLRNYCEADSKGKVTIKSNWAESGYDYRTVYMYCESQNYQAINNAKQAAYNENVKTQAAEKYGTKTFDQATGTYDTSGQTEDQKKAYNTEILGLTYDDEGNIINPFAKPASAVENGMEQDILMCEGDIAPDRYGCCPGETYTDMGLEDPANTDGPHTYACCPAGDGDCFPPIPVE